MHPPHPHRRRSIAPACVVAALFGAVAPPALAAPPIVSTFDGGAEGWAIVDLSCSNYSSVLGTYALDWLPASGDPGAHVGRVDPTSNCYFFNAPPAFLGDRSALAGGDLRFSLRTTVSDWPPGSVVVLIGANGVVLVSDIATPTAQWTRFSVPLTAAAFRLNVENGPAVPPAQFAAVLADLEALRISAEHGSELGEETTFLDSVIFGASCPGDLDGSGSVDGGDLGLMLAAWGSGDLLADLDRSGTVDGGDLGGLLAAWGACP